MELRSQRILLWTLAGVVVLTAALIVFNIYATFELADEAHSLKESLLAASAE